MHYKSILYITPYFSYNRPTWIQNIKKKAMNNANSDHNSNFLYNRYTYLGTNCYIKKINFFHSFVNVTNCCNMDLYKKHLKESKWWMN